MSEELPKFTLVEFPGFVTHASNAIQRMGGDAAVATAINNSDVLQLRHDPKSFRRPIPAESKDAKRTFLLNISIGSNNANEEASAHKKTSSRKIESKIIATITNRYVFDSLFDFRYTPMNAKEGPWYDNVFREGIQCKSTKDILTGSLDELWPYQLSNTVVPKPPLRFTAQSTVKSSNFSIIRIKADSKNVPQHPSDNASISESKLSVNAKDTLRVLKKLFSQRPVWTFLAIRRAVIYQGHSSESLLHELLPLVAYNFSNGPFAHCFCSFGYDPRSGPENRIYQAIQLRTETTTPTVELIRKQKKAISTKISVEGSGESNLSVQKLPDSQFQDHTSADNMRRLELNNGAFFVPGITPYSHQSIYQLCDILDEQIYHVIAKMVETDVGFRSQFDIKTGFFTANYLDKLRSRLKEGIPKDRCVVLTNEMIRSKVELFPNLVDIVGYLPYHSWQKNTPSNIATHGMNASASTHENNVHPLENNNAMEITQQNVEDQEMHNQFLSNYSNQLYDNDAIEPFDLLEHDGDIYEDDDEFNEEDNE